MNEDNNAAQIEISRQETLPRLSESAIEDYKRLLSDCTFEEEHPEQFAALKASVENALAATGQDREPPADPRSPAQRLHDQRMGVTPRSADQYADLPQEHRDFAAALSLPPDLARVIANELSNGSAPDKAE